MKEFMNMPMFEAKTSEHKESLRGERNCITRKESFIEFVDDINTKFEWATYEKVLIYKSEMNDGTRYTRVFTDVIMIVEETGAFTTWGFKVG